MAMNGIYNYNNYIMGSKKYNSPNENGINMAMVAKGRLYESMESQGEKYYGVSYTSEMQKEGKIQIPDDKSPGKYKVVDVDTDEGKARLAELEKERTDALAELKKYEEFRNPTPAKAATETKPTENAVTEAKDNSGIVNDLKPKENKHHKGDNQHTGTYTKHGTMRPDMDQLREVKSGMRGNVSAFKQMVYAHTKAQAQHAKKAGGDPAFKDMMKDIMNNSPEEAQKAISADGEWGVNKTAGRLLDFAIALSGGDPEKIDLLRNAVQKGFNAAAKVWGGALPGICYDTLQKVMDGFDEWAKSGSAEAGRALISA